MNTQITLEKYVTDLIKIATNRHSYGDRDPWSSYPEDVSKLPPKVEILRYIEGNGLWDKFVDSEWTGREGIYLLKTERGYDFFRSERGQDLSHRLFDRLEDAVAYKLDHAIRSAHSEINRIYFKK